MIDRESRKAAMAISQGGSIEDSTSTKVAAYGLLARALDPAALEGGIALEKAPENLGQLELALATTLAKAAHKGFFGLDRVTRNEIHELLSGRIPNARYSVGGLALTGLTRLMQGCGTGARSSIMTMRTIAQKQAAGEKVSESGLYASSKAPFLVAMMHLNDLFVDREQYDIWGVAEGGDNGQVFRAADVRLDFNSGLNLTNVPDDLATPEEKIVHGPQIGCPATLVKGYLREVHKITTDAALDAGLVVAS